MGQEPRRSVSQLQTFGLQSLLVLELLRSSSSESVRQLLICVCVCVCLCVCVSTRPLEWCSDAKRPTRGRLLPPERQMSALSAHECQTVEAQSCRSHAMRRTSVSLTALQQDATLCKHLHPSDYMIILKESSHNSYVLSILILRVFDAMCDPSPRTEPGTAAVMSLCQHSINKREHH